MTTPFIVFDAFWQTPAKTELHAYERLKASNWMAAGFIYVAFPWATLIDYIHTGKEIPKSLLDGYKQIQKEARLAAADTSLVTVCQHIYAVRYISLFKTCGIRRIYWSHCTLNCPSIGEIEIRPFPLYAVQSPSQYSTTSISYKERPYKACFVGAYNHRYYQTRIRKEILGLNELGRDDYSIIARDNWHYEEEVYGRQIMGNALDAEIKNKKLDHAEEYKQILLASTFSLCPSGSGPNSIRLWESLAFDTIPIIFADRLALPGNIQDWIKAAVFMSETATRDDIIRMIDRNASKSQSELEQKREAIRSIQKKYGNSCFVWDILVDSTFAKEQIISVVPKSIQNDDNTSCVPVNDKGKENLTLIIDPGLKDRGSHHDRINRLISDKHLNVIVISHENSAINASEFLYPVRSAFKTSIYDEDSAITPVEYRNILRSFTRTLVRELKAFDNACSIYIHSTTPSLIQSLAMALRIRGDSLRNLRLIYLQLMFGPYSIISNPKLIGSSRPRIRFATALKALEEVCRTRNIHLSIDTSNTIFYDQFSQLTGTNSIGIHPHVFSHGHTDSSYKLQKNGPILLHSGDCRPGKGLEWLGECLETLIKNTPAEAKFVIHIGMLRYPDAYPKIKLALEKIKRVAADNRDRVNLLEGRVNDKDWEFMVAQCSRIYLLHDPRYYQYKTSGNFFDAISVNNGGVPLYITKNTLSSLVAQKEGLTFGQITYNDTRSLIESINKYPSHPTYFGFGYENFASTYMNINHASYVIKKLTYHPLDEILK